jgi:hypothetical protein
VDPFGIIKREAIIFFHKNMIVRRTQINDPGKYRFFLFDLFDRQIGPGREQFLQAGFENVVTVQDNENGQREAGPERGQ